MPELLRRLARIARSYVYDLITPAADDAFTWRADSASHRDTAPPHHSTASSAGPTPEHDLPYSEKLAGSYRALDLPFGAPMEQVSKRWKAYLRQCHPDRHANDPTRLADATRLTQELTQAYETIKAAWARQRA